MNSTQEEKLKALASELARDIKTGEDLSALSSQLVKLTVEAALGAEMERHLGYPESVLDFKKKLSHLGKSGNYQLSIAEIIHCFPTTNGFHSK